MKKNKMMRAAGVLLIAVLLTTSLISGTFAKYVTGDTASDKARVAMFGVKIEASGSLFDTNYIAGNTNGSGNTPGSTGNVTVTSSTDASVVAPGTKNTDGMIFSITGKPEVTVNVSITIDEDASDIWLGNGINYPNMTTGDVFNSSPVNWDEKRHSAVTFGTSNYYPIKYTLQHADSNDAAGWEKATTVVNAKPLNEVINYLKTLSEGNSTTYAPGTDLAEKFGYYKLTWEWAFENSADKEDTLLGDLAAKKYGTTSAQNNTIVDKAIAAITAASDNKVVPSLTEVSASTSDKTMALQSQYNLEALLNFTITVTQVD